MYNILIFGLHNDRDSLRQIFSALPCKFVHVDSPAEFYSTAFSRIFDAWIIESDHPGFAEIALPELTAVHRTPHILLYGNNGPGQTGRDSDHANRVTRHAKKDMSNCAELFSQLMQNEKAKNR